MIIIDAERYPRGLTRLVSRRWSAAYETAFLPIGSGSEPAAVEGHRVGHRCRGMPGSTGPAREPARERGHGAGLIRRRGPAVEIRRRQPDVATLQPSANPAPSLAGGFGHPVHGARRGGRHEHLHQAERPDDDAGRRAGHTAWSPRLSGHYPPRQAGVRAERSVTGAAGRPVPAPSERSPTRSGWPAPTTPAWTGQTRQGHPRSSAPESPHHRGSPPRPSPQAPRRLDAGRPRRCPPTQADHAGRRSPRCAATGPAPAAARGRALHLGPR